MKCLSQNIAAYAKLLHQLTLGGHLISRMKGIVIYNAVQSIHYFLIK